MLTRCAIPMPTTNPRPKPVDPSDIDHYHASVRGALDRPETAALEVGLALLATMAAPHLDGTARLPAGTSSSRCVRRRVDLSVGVALHRSIQRPAGQPSRGRYALDGSDSGRVLVGMQVPAADRDALTTFLAELGYRHWDETDNPAYRLFL